MRCAAGGNEEEEGGRPFVNCTRGDRSKKSRSGHHHVVAVELLRTQQLTTTTTTSCKVKTSQHLAPTVVVVVVVVAGGGGGAPSPPPTSLQLITKPSRTERATVSNLSASHTRLQVLDGMVLDGIGWYWIGQVHRMRQGVLGGAARASIHAFKASCANTHEGADKLSRRAWSAAHPSRCAHFLQVSCFDPRNCCTAGPWP